MVQMLVLVLGLGKVLALVLGPALVLLYGQLRLEVNDLDTIAAGIEPAGGRVLSNGILDLQGSLGEHWSRALQVADPDGHRLQLVSH